MHGFLNVFLAAALARQGASEATLTHILGTEHLLPLEFNDAGVHGDGWFVSTEQLEASRRSFAVSFGSCSFEEPLADLRELGLL
jgi:hypothetical protein